LDAPDNQYDVIVGVSVGSINAFGYGVFGKGEELKAADFMQSKWLGLTTDKIWQFWNKLPFWDIFQGIFEPGLVNDQPMYEFVFDLK
jgi:predicted acylesterase/phospholipase RssA